MKGYNGYRSWNSWNVSLWIANDEWLYRLGLDCLSQCNGNVSKAARKFLGYVGGERTPDGARFNLTCVREALAGIKD